MHTFYYLVGNFKAMRNTFSLLVLSTIFFSCSSEMPNEREGITWKSIEKELQTRLITAQDGDTIQLPEGYFSFSKSLMMEGKSGVVVLGAGMEKTVLSFARQEEGAEGIKISNSRNILLQDFTIEDSKGDNIKVSDTKGITFRRIKSQWTGGPKTENGAYALYPVICTNVLIEECVAVGASDAGIYVGQSDTVIIRNNKAYWNVAGIESENSSHVEVYGNEAFENTGGILVFDLPGLTRYGNKIRVYNNNVWENNLDNFAPAGNIVASVPPGTGIMLLATREVEINHNEINNNKTVGLAIVSYDLVATVSAESEQAEGTIEAGTAQNVNNNYKMDSLYNSIPDQINIHDNQYSNSYWFPTLQSDFGKLFLIKSPFNVPDVVWDGITQDDSGKISLCINEVADITFINLDAAHDFENLSKDASLFSCK